MPKPKSEARAARREVGAARARRGLTHVAVLLACACGGGGGAGPTPVPRSIAPSTGYAGLTTAVRIEGDDFAARPDGKGNIDTRHRAWLGDVELADVTWIDAHTLEATAPAALSPGVLALKVQNAYGRVGTLPSAFTTLAIPAQLSASIAASRSTAGLDQPIDVTFTVTNGGTGAADLAEVSPSHAGPAAACGAPSPATGVTLAPGATQRYTWSCAGAASGALVLDASVIGTDATSGAPLALTAASAAQVAVQAPARLAATVAVDGAPGTVLVGQAIGLRVEVTNQGGAAALLGSLGITPPEAGCGVPSPALPQTVAGGATLALTSTCAATTPGSLAPAASVRGQDGNTSGLLTASATLTPALTVQAPAALTATVAATLTTVAVGHATDVTLYVMNGPALPTALVTSVAPWTTGDGRAGCTAVTVPPGTAIAAGATQVFEWTCTATQAGPLLLGATLYYTAGGTPGNVSPAVPVAATITP